jgi:hypothetical protein
VEVRKKYTFSAGNAEDRKCAVPMRVEDNAEMLVTELGHEGVASFSRLG